MAKLKTILSILAFGLMLNAHSQEFVGQVFSAKDSIPIPFVNIYTNDFENFTSSSASGRFSLRVNEGDTINFSSVGFRGKQMIIYLLTSVERKIYLNHVTYELPGLTIYGRNPMEGFYDHNRLYNPETEKTFEEKFQKPGFSLTPGGAGVTGLLTLLANQFNSEYKQLKKLREIKKDEYSYFRKLELIAARLPTNYVVQNTSLEKNEVQEFIEFWDPSLEFMEIANDYELLTLVQEQEILYLKKMSKDNQGKGVVSTLELRKLLDGNQ
ncbi:MAG: hypothetical protein RJQ09_06895 [Cyclobacteriaceae bacterium]